MPVRNVWIYWENKEGCSDPPYISLCRRILVKNSPSCQVNLVTPENLYLYLPDLPPAINMVSWAQEPDKLSLAIKCDFIRAFLLEEYGGVYVDSDAIILQDLSVVHQLLEQWEYVGMRRTSLGKNHVSNGFLGSVPGGKIITALANRLRAMLAERTTFEWPDAGAFALTPCVDQYPETAYLFPENRIHPIVAERQLEFSSTERRVEDYLAADPLMFMLFHGLFDGSLKEFPEKAGNWSEERLMSGDMLLAKIFRYALGRS